MYWRLGSITLGTYEIHTACKWKLQDVYELVKGDGMFGREHLAGRKFMS